MFLRISQNSPEKTCVRVSFLIKLYAVGLQPYKKEIPVHMFSSEYWKKIQTNVFTEHLRGRLLLNYLKFIFVLVACSPGMYLNETSNHCTSCPQGSFTSTSANTECAKCPADASTLKHQSVKCISM